MKDLSQRIASLSPQQRALLLLRVQKKTAEIADDNIARLPRDADKTSFALSFAQQRLWFLDQLEPGIAYYNISMSWRLIGALGVAVLHQSFSDIVSRHEVLRTSFATVDEQPIQIVHSTKTLPLTVVDLRGYPDESRESEAHRLVMAESNRPFDLSCPPLMRVCLVRVADREHLMSVTMHHIVSDGWSMGVLFRELMQLYEAHIGGRSLPLTELAIQYADYAQWQRQRLQGKALDEDVAYWEQQLAGAPPLINLPLDRPRPAFKTYRGARESRVLSKTLSDSLNTLSQSEGATLFMTLLAGFKLLLWRYSESDDIVVGSPVANRDRTEIEGLIGFFVSTLILRTDLSGDPTFRELLARVREVSLGAYAHQRLPFEKLVEALRPQRNASYSPLFQVMFALQNANPHRLALAGLAVEPLATQRETAKFDLSLVCDEDSQGLKVTAIHNTDLFNAGTIAQLLAHFESLLEQIAADPGQRIAQLFPLAQTESQRFANKRLTVAAGSVPVEEGCAPLSAAQTRLWILHRLDPQSTAFNRPVAVRLGGRLDPDCLAKSINAIIERHEALRTVFLERDGQPLQRVLPSEPVALQLQDLTGLGAETREQAALNIAAEAAQQTIDLSLGPMVRAVLLRLSECEHVLLLLMHHIVIDGWSEGVLLHELAVLYEAFLQGQPSPLPQLPIQHAEFAIAQREHLAGTALQRQLAYWQRQLEQLPVLELGTDYRRPDVPSNRAATVNMILPATLAERLETLCRREGATLFMGLLAIFEVLLARYSRQDDFAVGVPIAGRATVESESLIGCFMNVLVLRAGVSGDPSFRELLARVRDTALDAYANQEMPFEKLIEALRPERVTNRWPLFQTMLQLRNLPNFDADGAGALKITSFKFDSSSIGGLDLNVEVVKVAGELHCAFIYARELFRGDTIVRMAQHFCALAQACADEPDRLPGALPTLSEEEHRALIEWNATQTDYPREHCIHQLFETMVEQTPDATALVFEAGRLSYCDLNSRANSLAHYLRGLGVGANVIVGLCVPRSIEMIVGVLGILKAGGAYLPLDPVYPKERLAFMLDDAQVPVLLTLASLADVLPSHTARRICLDTDWPMIAQEGVNNPICETNPRNLAYVIYTSGSTGTPKGVVVEHGSLVNYSASAVADYALHAGDRVLQFASLNFDASAEEIYPCLIRGATLVLRDDEMLSSAAQFLRTCADWKVSVLSLPTAWWHDIAASVIPEELAIPPSLRLVIIGGEAAAAGRLASWQQWTGSRVELINTYGPTEATVVATRWKAPQAINDLAAIPIGRPIANTQVYILDPRLNPVPIGVPGELFVGGAGLARGYLNRPELTAEKFIANSFGAGRLYKTGDLARFLPDGNIEFLGRIDTQVKIRGFRIELGEIEAALSQHPAIREVAVIAREDVPGDKRLVAYFVAENPPADLVGELRVHLRASLPEYMVPAAFVLLEAFPLTPNGKIDRKALPVPDASVELKAAYVAPRTPAEEILAGIWAEVLGLERVGVEDNFFELGGHSLLAMRAVSRVRQALSVELSLRDLFAAATVARLGSRIETLRTEARPVLTVPPLEAIAEPGPAELSFSQQRLWVLDQIEPGGAAYLSAGALELRGALDAPVLERALGALVHRHESLRTVFESVEGQPLQVVSEPGAWTLPVADLSGEVEAAERLKTLLREEASRGFDLARGPLFRARLYRLAPDTHVLLLAMHHIISDGWSMGVLNRELGELYRGFSRGEAPALPVLSLRYRDFARWQRSWLEGEALEGLLVHWRARLTGAPQVLELPIDRPRPPVESQRGARYSFRLPLELAQALRGLARREGATLFMTLLSGFTLLLSRYSGQQDLLVGTPVANRSRAEIEDMVGFFVNTLVLRADLSGDLSASQFLARMREVCLDAYTHQDLPFERLVEEMRPARDLSRNPLFQVMFALQNAPLRPLELPGLTLRPVDVERGAAQFDLTLQMQETAEGLSGSFNYATDLFDEPTIVRMATHLRSLLEGMSATPERCVWELPLLTEAERQQLLVEWNNTTTDYPADALLHELFEAQVERTPKRIALRVGTTALSYAELDTDATRMAQALRSRGVGRGERVGLCVERGADMLAAVLGILKAGAAYVPLDPSFPAERLRFMAEDAQLTLLVSTTALAGSFGLPAERQLLLDADARSIASAPETRLPIDACSAQPEDPAYVIYTSGSTGKPKGIVVPHRAVVNFLTSMAREPGLAADDVLVAVATLSFDIAVLELQLPLTLGATVVMASRDEAIDGHALRALLEHATVMQATPATWRLLIDAGWRASKNFKALVGGEALPKDLAEELLARGVALWNLYGPTETTVWSTCARITDTDNGISIGKPIANTTVCILDAQQNLCPIGVPGELCIGGDGVTLGYWNRPELTAERFIPDSFRTSTSEARLYRTGDRARWRDDGTLEHLGRLDDQVKVRGFRVELGEIGAVLAEHPDVRQAAVHLWTVKADDARIVACCVPAKAGVLGPIGLRKHLRTRLPEYMVPQYFLPVNEIPLTPNGKVDRRRLPTPVVAESRIGRHEAPADPVEATIAEIWTQLIHPARPIGRIDKFFEMGGHSLLGIKALRQIENKLGVRLEFRVLFQESLADIATRCRSERTAG